MKYEYQLVTTTDFFSLREDYENRDLWCKVNGDLYFIDDLADLLDAFENNEIYKRVEVVWQDEVITKARSLKIDDNQHSVYETVLADILECPEVFLELSRIALRATGELK